MLRIVVPCVATAINGITAAVVDVRVSDVVIVVVDDDVVVAAPASVIAPTS